MAAEDNKTAATGKSQFEQKMSYSNPKSLLLQQSDKASKIHSQRRCGCKDDGLQDAGDRTHQTFNQLRLSFGVFHIDLVRSR